LSTPLDIKFESPEPVVRWHAANGRTLHQKPASRSRAAYALAVTVLGARRIDCNLARGNAKHWSDASRGIVEQLRTKPIGVRRREKNKCIFCLALHCIAVDGRHEPVQVIALTWIWASGKWQKEYYHIT